MTYPTDNHNSVRNKGRFQKTPEERVVITRDQARRVIRDFKKVRAMEAEGVITDHTPERKAKYFAPYWEAYRQAQANLRETRALRQVA